MLALAACEQDHSILINTFRIESDPPADELIKVLYISDIHYREGQVVFDELVKLAESVEPDVIFLGGDYTGMRPIDTNRFRDFMVSELSKLAQVARTYVVLGNHEYYSDSYKWRQKFITSPLRLIDGETERQTINGRDVCVRGLSDAYTSHYQHIPFGFDCSGLKLTVTHDPYAVELDPEDGLYLAGHTHCGQFRLPFIKSFWTPTYASNEFWCGYGRQGDKEWITSAGVGTSIISMRIGTKASVELIEIY